MTLFMGISKNERVGGKSKEMGVHQVDHRLRWKIAVWAPLVPHHHWNLSTWPHWPHAFHSRNNAIPYPRCHTISVANVSRHSSLPMILGLIMSSLGHSRDFAVLKHVETISGSKKSSVSAGANSQTMEIRSLSFRTPREDAKTLPR
jgi:hypothetical protein